MPLTPDAQRLMEEFGKEMGVRLDQAGGLSRSAFGKARGSALRLSLVLEWLWCCARADMSLPPDSISKEAFAAAATLVQSTSCRWRACLATPATMSSDAATRPGGSQERPTSACRMLREVGCRVRWPSRSRRGRPVGRGRLAAKPPKPSLANRAAGSLTPSTSAPGGDGAVARTVQNPATVDRRADRQ